MTRTGRFCAHLLVLFLVITHGAFSAHAGTIVVAVEDKDYSPYYVWVDGKPTGPCIDITVGAASEMGDEVEFVRFPWSRVLRAVEEGKVDAGLCGTRTTDREVFSHYPSEPLLNYDATLFVRADSPFTVFDVSVLAGKSFAVVKGYEFAGLDQDLEEAGMVRVEATSRESLWNLLAIGRIDTALDSTLPMVADTARMGIAGEIRALQPSLAETPGYLFFSRAAGHEELAKRFSEALVAFKETPDYRAIESRYGL